MCVACAGKLTLVDLATEIVVEELEVAHMLAIRLRVKAYVLDVRYEKAFQSDIVLRGTQLLNEHKIARPKISSERT